ncbi:MAG: alkaline phosphatase family protein [Bacteriovoracaceae bacterium]
MKILLLISILFSPLIYSKVPNKRVVVLGFDGLGGYWMRKNMEQMPFTQSLFNISVHTTKMRCILPTYSGPNWAGILRGTRPIVHGVFNNKIQPIRKKAPLTIFEVLRNNYPGIKMKVIADWHGIPEILRDNTFLTKIDSKYEIKDDALNKTIQAINEGNHFVFTHFDNADHAGHAHGWGSMKYLEAMRYVDYAIKKVYDHLKVNNLLDKVDIIITSDHGGSGKGHKGFIRGQVRDIPFIAIGPSFKKGYEIKQFLLRNFQVPHIVAKVFNVMTPKNWSFHGDIDDIYR